MMMSFFTAMRTAESAMSSPSSTIRLMGGRAGAHVRFTGRSSKSYFAEVLRRWSVVDWLARANPGSGCGISASWRTAKFAGSPERFKRPLLLHNMLFDQLIHIRG
jgi:hypothetical protein